MLHKFPSPDLCTLTKKKGSLWKWRPARRQSAILSAYPIPITVLSYFTGFILGINCSALFPVVVLSTGECILRPPCSSIGSVVIYVDMASATVSTGPTGAVDTVLCGTPVRITEVCTAKFISKICFAPALMPVVRCSISAVTVLRITVRDFNPLCNSLGFYLTGVGSGDES